MPFRSQAQRAFMFANHPDIAARWEALTPKGAVLPKHVLSRRAKVKAAKRRLAKR